MLCSDSLAWCMRVVPLVFHSCLLITQLVSLTVAELAVIFLPLDAANNSGDIACGESWSDIFCGALDMSTAWFAIFMMIFILAFFIVPYTIFYYEEDDSLALT